MPGIDNSEKNIYRICRLRANEMRADDSLKSREKAEREFSAQDKCISAASLKDYELDNTVPHPDTVRAMAKVYGTPELMWMHCSKKCSIGHEIVRVDDEIGTDDLYGTYFELAGSFDKIGEIERQLHSIIDDKRLSEQEVPMLREILRVMDRIAENAKDLRIWMAKEGYDTIEDEG